MPGALWGNFTQNGRPVAWTLKVPLAHLDGLGEPVLESWRRAIQREVGRAGRSSYLRFKRPALYPMLVQHDLRQIVVRHAHP